MEGYTWLNIKERKKKETKQKGPHTKSDEKDSYQLFKTLQQNWH